MARFRLFFCCALLSAFVACHRGGQVEVQASLAPMLIDDRGIVMPLEAAVAKIAYRPWLPPNAPLKFAIIPPLGDLDTPAHRGIAIEYADGRQPMLLSEWPKQNFSLLFLHNADVTNLPCTVAHYKDNGIAWTTRGKLAMTLQPDGPMDPKLVEKEGRRLIAAGACR